MQPAAFGKYKITGKLLGGGMGRVYLAEDGEKGVKVALKLIDLGPDPDTQEVLEAERRGAALQERLSEIDPRVARIAEVGERDGYFYIAMEYVEGRDLSEILTHGPLPAPRAVAVAIEICEVLAHAHSLDASLDGREYHGIVHGDIKPRNIRITPEGRVKLLDFGIAKALSASRNFTRNQFGSVAYSSPERLNTGEVDAASDIWSVGILLFEMLQGLPYFRAENVSKMECQIRDYQALLPSLEEVAPGAREILARALSPVPQCRYRTAEDLAADLAAWREGRLAVSSDDPEATRRTAPLSDDATRRSASTGSEEATRRTAAAPRPAKTPHPRRRAVIWLVVFGLLGLGFLVESNNWKQASQLQRDLETDHLTDMDAVWARYQKIEDGRWLPIRPFGLRGAIESRLEAQADRVLAEYRESDVASVYQRDWEQARTALARALELRPGDKKVTAKLRVCEGHLARINASGRSQGRAVREAREKFEEAKQLAAKLPDAHLGLMQLDIYNLKDVEKAEQELKEAERYGFRPGKRVKAQLADGYYDRADGWVRESLRAAGLPQGQDYLKRADSDYAHAAGLYQDIAPYGNSIAMIRRIYDSRADVARRLELLKGPTP